MPNLLVEKRNELEAKQKELAEIFDQAGSDMDLTKSNALEEFADPAAKAAEVKRRNDELNSIGKEVEDLQDVAKAATDSQGWGKYLKEPIYPTGFHGDGSGRGDRPGTKSVGMRVTASGEFKTNSRLMKMSLPEAEFKATFTTTAGWTPEALRIDRMELSPQRPPQVMDLMPMIPTGFNAVNYVEETTFTNTAAERAEAGTVAEATLVTTPRSQPVQSVDVLLPTTQEQLEDVAGAQAYIDARLSLMVFQRVDSQVLNGNGTAPNLLGVRNATGINSHPKTADESVFHAIMAGLTDVRVEGRAIPDAVIMHPTDYMNMRLLQDANGNFIMGPPGMATEMRVFGYPIVEADSLPLGTAVAGDFARYSAIYDRRQIDIEISDSHSDFFAKRQLALRAGVRLAAVWFRPKAFSSISGL